MTTTHEAQVRDLLQQWAAFARPSVCAKNLRPGKLRTSTSRNPSSSRVPSGYQLGARRQTNSLILVEFVCSADRL